MDGLGRVKQNDQVERGRREGEEEGNKGKAAKIKGHLRVV